LNVPVVRHVALFAMLACGACVHRPTEKERLGAQIHYDLGLNAQLAGRAQEAYQELKEAVRLDPFNADVHNALGLVLHLSFAKWDDAQAHYKRALELRPDFSEAHTNFGNLLVDKEQYDAAIQHYELALNDMLYSTPFIAQGNLGWALYKKGDVEGAIDRIKAAVTTNPRFCQGFRNLGLIYAETTRPKEACVQFGRYRDACPDVPDALYREGRCLVEVGDKEKARSNFEACVAKAGSGTEVGKDCTSLLGLMN
jgi:type IV pilus assembly protein PilF